MPVCLGWEVVEGESDAVDISEPVIDDIRATLTQFNERDLHLPCDTKPARPESMLLPGTTSRISTNRNA